MKKSMGLSARQYHLLKLISRYGDEGLPFDKAKRTNQHTLGSLFYRKLVRITRNLSFVITTNGDDILHFYESVEIKRKVVGKWAKKIYITNVKLTIKGEKVDRAKVKRG